MCGIVGVLYRRPSGVAVPDVGRSLAALDEAVERLRASAARPDAGDLASIADGLEALDGALRGPLGTMALLGAAGLEDLLGLEQRAATLGSLLADLESALDAGEVFWAGDQLEAGNAVLVRLKDVVWALGRDRTSTARGVADLAENAVG